MKQDIFQVTGTGKSADRSIRTGRVFGWWYRVIGLALILVLIRPTDAWAYVDPSTGGYLLQMLLAGILAVAFAIRMFWQNLKSYYTRLFGGKPRAESDQDGPKE